MKPLSVRKDSPRFQALLSRHKAFWQRGAHSSLRSFGVFAPSARVALRQPDGSVITQAERLEPDMVDPGALIRAFRTWDPDEDAHLTFHRRFCAFPGVGDLMPFSQPYFKIPWIEAMLGCPIKMTEGQIWVDRYEGEPERAIRNGVRFEHNPWFQLYQEFLRQLQNLIGDRYPVSANTLLRGTSDLAAAIMGVKEACIGWIEEPALMARLMRVCTDANLAVIDAGNKTLAPFQGGYMSGFALWSPGPVVRTQADHSTLLSAQMYERQILPYDLEVIRACPVCIFHIHNNGLHVAPLLTEIPELDAIEIVVDPYPQGERRAFEIEAMQTIQEHKPLILDANFPTFEEAERVRDQLDPHGLCLNARFDAETFFSLPKSADSEMWVLD